MQAAAAPVAGVDAGGGFEFRGPLWVELASEAAELIEWMLIGQKFRGGQNSGAGPACFATDEVFVDDLDGAAVFGEVPGERETDDAAANDQNVVHGVTIPIAALSLEKVEPSP